MVSPESNQASRSYLEGSGQATGPLRTGECPEQGDDTVPLALIPHQELTVLPPHPPSAHQAELAALVMRG